MKAKGFRRIAVVIAVSIVSACRDSGPNNDELKAAMVEYGYQWIKLEKKGPCEFLPDHPYKCPVELNNGRNSLNGPHAIFVQNTKKGWLVVGLSKQ